jgi:type I restriction-modification system DNA methylase subunit
MGKSYVCQDCKMEFDQKSHYDRHANKKIPCVLKDKPLKDVINDAISKQVSKIIKEENKNIIISSKNIDSDTEEEKQTTKPKSTRKKPVKKDEVKDEVDYSYLRLPDNEIIFELDENDNKNKSESKKNILKMIDKGHNILYNAENIEGEDALNDIMNFIFIKSIQPIISDKKEDGKIDLLDKSYYDKLYPDDILTEILSYFKDLKLMAIQPLDAIRKMSESTDIIRQMGEILKTHPITGQIFTENNFIVAKKAPTIQLLLNEVINKININELELNEDVIGEIYEHIINDYVKKGSKLGQFFTPRKLMKLILQYKEDRFIEIIKKIDKKEKIKLSDTCMGTGGWLVTGYNMLKEKYSNRLLLSGGEVKPSTFQYGLMNLILTLKKFPHDVHCESSLTHINDIKHHFVLTNPPFQTDKKFDHIKENFKSDEYTKKNKIKLDDVYDLKDNSPPIQFLELDLYKLEENGLCLIILPYGELFFGSSYSKERTHFMKETNITDIILFAGGTFTHTGIKTCGLIFEKDKKGTKAINFIQANKECNTLTKITTVTIDDIVKEPNSSWYLRDYLKDEYIESLSTKITNFEWIEFGDIFKLQKGTVQSSKVEEDENGEGVMVTQSKNMNDYKKIKEYTLNGNNLFVGNIDSGRKFCIIYYEGKCDYTNLLSLCKINDNYKNKINIKYIYYYLQSIHIHLTDVYLKGSCNLSLDQKNFNRMKIPIPPLEEQKKIIQNIIEIEDTSKDILKGLEGNKKMRRTYIESMIKGASNKGINIIKSIGDISDIQYGERITKENDGDENGEYPVYGGGEESFYTTKYNREGTTCKISRFGMSEKNCVLLLNKKYYLNDSGFTIKSNNNIINDIYLWNYLMLIKLSIFNTGMDLAQRNIMMEKFKNLKIPIPPLEYQKQIESTLIMMDNIDNNLNDMMKKITDNIRTAFLNSLDDYGNPNSFNIDKLIQSDSEEEIKEVPKNKNKTKSKSVIV